MSGSQQSSQYVSPSLGPTNPWSQQTLTGTFRPPSACSAPTSAPTAAVAGFALPRASQVGHHPQREVSGADELHRYSPVQGLAPVAHPQGEGHCPDEGGIPSHIASSRAIDRFMDMIVNEVQRGRDMYMFQQESNRALEEALKREQLRRQETQRTLESVKKGVLSMQELLVAQNAMISELR